MEDGGGQVYLGVHPDQPSAPVTVQIPSAAVQADPTERARVRQLAEALVGRTLPGVLPVREVGEQDGLLYAVLDIPDGIALATWLDALVRQQSRFAPDFALSMTLQVARAMLALREVIPDHVLGGFRPTRLRLSAQGQIWLCPLCVGGPLVDGEGQELRTQLAWASSEVLLGQAPKEASDVRGLHLLLFTLVTGRNPFLRDHTAMTMTAVLRREIPTLPESVDQDVIGPAAAVLSEPRAERLPGLRQTEATLTRLIEARGGQPSPQAWEQLAATLGLVGAPATPEPPPLPDADLTLTVPRAAGPSRPLLVATLALLVALGAWIALHLA